VKVREEAEELIGASTRDETIHEAADLLYFTLVAMVRSGVGLDEVAAELDRRALKVRRRGETAAVKTEARS
jgi:phosphoribosyl-ATP pyrophosphohydrolase/phosphoribosyl-AMP cyclohydrolase/histidinol dehydrogenase